jgi:iron complex outermembrane receptor protein
MAIVATLCLTLSDPASLWARESEDPSLGEISVVGKKVPTPVELQSTTATVVPREKIVNRVYVTPVDILRSSPGVAITQYGEGGVPTMVKMRGFSGAHTYGVAFFLDEEGLNEPGGAADNSMFNPIEIDRVEIIKGPSSVLYGNYASGGVVHYHTISRENATRFNVRYGSFNTQDGSGIIARTGDLIDQAYSFQVYHTDGYRDNSDWDKYNLAARWTVHPSDSFVATLGVRTYYSDWDSAGYIPNYLPPKTAVDDGSGEGNGGQRKYQGVNFQANYFINDDQTINFHAYFAKRENIRYSKSWVLPTTAIGTVSGSESNNPLDKWGLGGSYKFDGLLGGRKFSFLTGMDFVKESEHRQTWQLSWGNGRRRGNKTRDLTYDVNTFSVYGEANYQVFEPLMIRAGLRYDKLTGDLESKLTETSAGLVRGGKYTSKGFTAKSPKFGLLYTPIEKLQLYANFSRGFQAPLASGVSFFNDPSQGISKRDQYEVGFRAQPLDWIETGVGYYRLYTDKDLVYDPVSDLTKNVGETLRTGLETYADFTPWKNWLFHADYTYQTATYKKYFVRLSTTPLEVFDAKGRRLEEVPRHIANIEISYDPPEGLGGRLNFNYNADFKVRDYPYAGGVQVWNPNGQDYGRLDLQLNYKFSEKYQVVLDFINVLDKKYIGYQAAAAETAAFYTYSPLQPLTVYLGLNVKLD